MGMKIERDQRRFRQIVRGRIRKNLRKYVTHGEMIGRKGRDLVSIPVPQLDIPHFRYGDNTSSAAGLHWISSRYRHRAKLDRTFRCMRMQRKVRRSHHPQSMPAS